MRDDRKACDEMCPTFWSSKVDCKRACSALENSLSEPDPCRVVGLCESADTTTSSTTSSEPPSVTSHTVPSSSTSPPWSHTADGRALSTDDKLDAILYQLNLLQQEQKELRSLLEQQSTCKDSSTTTPPTHPSSSAQPPPPPLSTTPAHPSHAPPLGPTSATPPPRSPPPPPPHLDDQLAHASRHVLSCHPVVFLVSLGVVHVLVTWVERMFDQWITVANENLGFVSLAQQMFDVVLVFLGIGVMGIYEMRSFWLFLVSFGWYPERAWIEQLVLKSVVTGQSVITVSSTVLWAYLFYFHLNRLSINIPKPTSKDLSIYTTFTSLSLIKLFLILQDVLVLVLMLTGYSLSYVYVTLIVMSIQITTLMRRLALLMQSLYQRDVVSDDSVAFFFGVYTLLLLLMVAGLDSIDTGIITRLTRVLLIVNVVATAFFHGRAVFARFHLKGQQQYQQQ